MPRLRSRHAVVGGGLVGGAAASKLGGAGLAIAGTAIGIPSLAVIGAGVGVGALAVFGISKAYRLAQRANSARGADSDELTP